MSKWYGKIGFSIAKETRPGFFQEVVEERSYAGDLSRNQRSWEVGEGLNDNLNISNIISIVADPYAYQNFHAIRYLTFMGSKWKVKTVEVTYPRLILTIGGVYNEQTDDATDSSGEDSGSEEGLLPAPSDY